MGGKKFGHAILQDPISLREKRPLRRIGPPAV
jgi:hypothetical protein